MKSAYHIVYIIGCSSVTELKPTTLQKTLFIYVLNTTFETADSVPAHLHFPIYLCLFVLGYYVEILKL